MSYEWEGSALYPPNPAAVAERDLIKAAFRTPEGAQLLELWTRQYLLDAGGLAEDGRVSAYNEGQRYFVARVRAAALEDLESNGEKP